MISCRFNLNLDIADLAIVPKQGNQDHGRSQTQTK